MVMSAADVRRWMGNFEAAEQADRDQRRRDGARPEQSIALSLSLLEAAQIAAGDRTLIDPRRDTEHEAVRAVWARLRSRLHP